MFHMQHRLRIHPRNPGSPPSVPPSIPPIILPRIEIRDTPPIDPHINPLRPPIVPPHAPTQRLAICALQYRKQMRRKEVRTERFKTALTPF